MAQPLSNDLNDLGGQVFSEPTDLSDLGGTSEHDLSDLGGVTATASQTSQTPETDSALAKLNRLAKTPSPGWLQAPEQAIREQVSGMVPKTPLQYAEQVFPPLAAARQSAQIATGDVSSIPFVGRVPEIIQAEKTPAFSKERYATGLRTLMDVGMLAGSGEALRGGAPLRGEPLPFEPPPTRVVGPGTIAEDVSGAMQEQAIPEANQQLATDQGPPAPSAEEATAETPQVREPISLDELRLMRERNELRLQNDIAQRMTGGTHPAVDERLGQIDEELTNIANRELQPTTVGEPDASTITSPEGVPELEVRPQVGESAPLRQSGETAGAQGEPVSTGESVAPETPETNAPESITATLPDTTALANAVTSAERETRGLDPREEVARRSWEQAKAIADNEAATDPGKGARLVEELNQKPRALDDVEGAHLLRRKAEVNAEHDAAIRQMNANPEDVSAIARLKSAREELQKTYNAAEVSGTAWGRGGRIRQALMAEDFSVQAMEAKARAVGNKGKPLLDPQLRNVAEHYGKISKQEASIRLAENDLKSPTGRMQPQEILTEVEKMKQRLTPCL